MAWIAIEWSASEGITAKEGQGLCSTGEQSGYTGKLLIFVKLKK